MDDRRAHQIGWAVTVVIVLVTAMVIFWWWANGRRGLEYDRAMALSSLETVRALARQGTLEDERTFRAAVQRLESFLARNPRGRRATAVRSRLEAIEFEWANARGKVRLYAEYLQRYPHGDHAAVARAWVASVRAWLDCVRGPGGTAADRGGRIGLAIKEWYGKKTVECVTRTGAVFCGPDSKWRDASGVTRASGERLPVRETAARLLESAGYEVSEPGGNAVDRVLVLDVTGVAEGAHYSNVGRAYTGGSISATVRLVAPPEAVRESRFLLDQRPRSQIQFTAPDPRRRERASTDPSGTLLYIFGDTGEFEAALAGSVADVLGDAFLVDVVLRRAGMNSAALEQTLARRVEARCGPGTARWIAACAGDGRAYLEDTGKGPVVPARLR